MLMMSPKHEEFTRPVDAAKACTLFGRIERVLAEARADDKYPVDVLRRVRTLLRSEFSDLSIVRKFVLHDEDNFRDWSICVGYPDGREVTVTHES